MRAAEDIVYRIRFEGRLDPSWSDRLGAMAIELDESGPRPITTLTGRLVDQAALAGVLNTLVDLHLTLISVQRQEPGAEQLEQHGHGRPRR